MVTVLVKAFGLLGAKSTQFVQMRRAWLKGKWVSRGVGTMLTFLYWVRSQGPHGSWSHCHRAHTYSQAPLPLIFAGCGGTAPLSCFSLGLTGFPDGSSGKEPTCQCRRCKRHGFDPWVRKISWRRAWQPLQYSCLENFMVRGAWRAIVHRVVKSWTRLKQLSTQQACTLGPHRSLEGKSEWLGG